MGESSKFPKSSTFETQILKLAVCQLNIHNFKVRKVAKIRNKYNQVPHLTQDTTWESVKNTFKYHKRKPRGQPFPKFKWSFVFKQTVYKHKKAITIILIQDFELDFLRKVSLKILNSGMLLEIFTHAYMLHVSLFKVLYFRNFSPEFVISNNYRKIHICH